MKSLKEYLIENRKTFSFRLKTIVPITQAHRDQLEQILDKYKPLSFIESKTIHQKAPYDFAAVVEAGEVYIVDFEVELPINYYLLRQEVKNAWGCQEDYLIIRANNDQLEIYDQKAELEKEIDDEAAEKGLKLMPKLGTDRFYPEYEHTPDGSNYYGNEYNSKFLEILAQNSASRVENRVHPSTPLFDFLDYPDLGTEIESFNKDIPGAPMPKSKWTVKHTKIETPENIAQMGNFDNEPVEVKKEFIDEKGKKTVISKKAESIRKVK